MTDKTLVEASTAKYIGVWILMGILGTIVITAVDQAIAASLLSRRNIMTSPYWFVAPVAEYAAWAVTFVGVYSMVPSIRIGKVIPWIFILGGLGLTNTLVSLYASTSGSRIQVPDIFAVSMIASFIASAFFIRWYFKSKQSYRY